MELKQFIDDTRRKLSDIERRLNTLSSIVSEHFHYAEMYIYNNAVPTVIDEANTWHGAIGFSVGNLDTPHVSFHSSIQQAITVWADAGGGEVTATSAGIQAAGLEAGVFVTITGTTNYNGVYEIQSVAINSFNIIAAWAGNDGAGTVIMPSHFHVDRADAAGLWSVTGNGSLTPAANRKEYDMCFFVNGTPQQNTFMTHATKDSGDYDTVAFDALVELAHRDILWLAVMGKTDATNLIFKHANLAMAFIQ